MPEKSSHPAARGTELATLTWQQAQAVLTPDTVAVIPLGAATKEHGPHLPLNTDWLQVQYLAQQVLAQADVVLLPTIAYSYYPAFVDYPGSVSLGVAAARDTVLGICQSLARHGVRRFYVINYGISTNGPLRAAAHTLAGQGALLHYTDLTQGGPVKQALQQAQGVGSHADLVETSVMLFVAPEVVNMALAVADQHAEKNPGGLTRDAEGPGVYSPSGVYGNPLGATREHGRALVHELLQSLLRDIEVVRTAPLPAPEKP